MNYRFFAYGLPVLATAMLGLAGYHIRKMDRPMTPITPPAEPPRSPYRDRIAALGVAEPSSENISVGSALPGVVVEAFVTSEQVGKRVKKGDPLLRVDDRHLHAELEVAEAKVEIAEAQLQRLRELPRPEEIPPSEANVRNAQALAKKLEDDCLRAEATFKNGAGTASEATTKRLIYTAAQHQLDQAKAQLELLKVGAWGPDKKIAAANLAEAKAAAQRIRTEIERSCVRAPIDGNVLQVNIHVGEVVAAQPREPLYVLGNVDEIRIRVDIDENDIPRFDSAQTAVAQVRGAHDEPLSLRFCRVEPLVHGKRSLTGSNTERVDTRVLQVIYALDANEQRVFVGQLFDVFISTKPSGK
jgi:multidrug resistance efflux pump